MSAQLLQRHWDRPWSHHAGRAAAWGLGAAAILAIGSLVGKLAALYLEPGVQLAAGVILPAGVVLAVFLVLSHSHLGLSPLNPLMYVGLFWLLLFVLEPLLIAFRQAESVPYVRSLSFGQVAEHAAQAGLLCALSYLSTALAFAAVGAIAGKVRVARDTPPGPGKRAIARRPGMGLVVFSLIFVGAAGLMLFSGLIPIILDQPENRSELLTGTGVLYTLVLAFVALPVAWVSASGGRPRWRSLIPVCGLGLGAMALFGGRAEIATAMLAAFFAYLAFRRPTRRQVLALVAIAALGLLVFSAAFFAVRAERVYRDADPELLRAKTTLTAGFRNTLSPYDHLIAYLDTIGAHPASRVPEMATGLARGILPRAWVGEKELDPAQVLFRTLYEKTHRVGTPFTLPGLFHYAGGVPGVIVGSFAFGAGLAFLYRVFLKRRHDPLIVAMYAYFLAQLSVLLWGVYVPAILHLIQVELLIVAVMGWARVLSGPQHSARIGAPVAAPDPMARGASVRSG